MNLVCVKCFAEAAVSLDLDDGDTLRCPACDETYTVDEVQAVVECWAKLLPWLKAHPARQQQPVEHAG